MPEILSEEVAPIPRDEARWLQYDFRYKSSWNTSPSARYIGGRRRRAEIEVRWVGNYMLSRSHRAKYLFSYSISQYGGASFITSRAART